MSPTVRVRMLGVVIAACGVALCHGAAELWPAGALASSPTVVDVLRILGAGITAILGVANIGAGLVILLLKPARE